MKEIYYRYGGGKEEEGQKKQKKNIKISCF